MAFIYPYSYLYFVPFSNTFNGNLLCITTPGGGTLLSVNNIINVVAKHVIFLKYIFCYF